MIPKSDSKDFGYLFVVGGPGSSGVSTISKLLSKEFSLQRIYAGDMYRDIVREKGYAELEDIYNGKNFDEMIEIDREVDRMVMNEIKDRDVVVDSKIFAALATKRDIPCTIKIWLDATLHVRAMRRLNKERVKTIRKYFEIRKNLVLREKVDGKRYMKLYGVNYDDPKLYNDIVLDTSHMNEKQTFNLILKYIKDGGYIK